MIRLNRFTSLVKSALVRVNPAEQDFRRISLQAEQICAGKGFMSDS